jgi:hypothetical protein
VITGEEGKVEKENEGVRKCRGKSRKNRIKEEK